MNAALRRPGCRSQHTLPVTLRLTDHQADYGSLTLPVLVSVLWGRAGGSIGGERYAPGPDEVEFVQLQQQIAPASLARKLDRAARSYVAENAEQCVRLVEHAP